MNLRMAELDRPCPYSHCLALGATKLPSFKIGTRRHTLLEPCRGQKALEVRDFNVQ